MAGIHVLGLGHLVQRRPGLDIGIVEHRRVFGFVGFAEGQHVAAVTCHVVADRSALGEFGVRMGFGEDRAKLADQRDVEPVEPDHRDVAVMAVIVPHPGRGEDQVADFHISLFAVDGGIGTGTLDDETQCAGRMTVCRRDFARHDELEPSIERFRNAGTTFKTGVLQHQHAAFGLFCRNHARRFHDIGPAHAIIPFIRDRRGHGFFGEQRVQHFP